MAHKKAALLDTSFIIRFLSEDCPLFRNADGYFRYFLQEDISMLISTISIAEYCVRGDIQELPLKNLRIIPFNLDHALKTSKFAKIAFSERKLGKLSIADRKVIPNDTKLFAQASCEKSIEYYLSSDTESKKIYETIRSKVSPNFQFIDIHLPYDKEFGVLDI